MASFLFFKSATAHSYPAVICSFELQTLDYATRAAEHKRPGHNEGSLVLIHRKSGHRLLPRITNISLAWEAGLQLIFELQPFHDFNVRVQLAKKGNVDK